MSVKTAAAAKSADRSTRCFDHSPLPTVTVGGTKHLVRYVNPAFCRLTGKAMGELVGKPFCAIVPDTDECQLLLDRIYQTRRAENYTKLNISDALADPVLSSYAMWPFVENEGAMGVVIQVVEAPSPHERTLAMNEALMLGSVRLHEASADVASLNLRLHAEIGVREQRERDALLLTGEMAHRIKNNLQIIFAMIAQEAKSAAAPCLDGYRAMQARIGAIAELYDLIAHASDGETIALDAYLREIARTMSESLLESTSGIRIEVKAEALDIDPVRAVPFGLLVNELGTNAIKHAFPHGTGRVLLSVEQTGEQIELTVADNGIGKKSKDAATRSGKHGSDYVAIFVRQVGGTIIVSPSEGIGTTIRVRFPLQAKVLGT